MRRQDAPAFAAAMTAAAETLGEPMSEHRIAGYFDALSEYEIDSVLRAIRDAIRSATHGFPKPAHIIALIDGDPEDRAALAWTRLLRALERVGTYQTVTFDDPAMHATIRALGGWTECWRLERMDDRELGFKRAEFVRLYGAMLKRPPTDAPALLIGQAEASNRQRGYFGHDAVVRIGDGGQAVEALPPVVQHALSSGGAA